MKRIFIIIVNWNGWKDTQACLSSVFSLNARAMHVTPVIVDNGSTDGSVGILKKKYPKMHFIALSRNFGFSGGNNAGIRYALQNGADAIWLLNNDTVVHADALVLADALQKHAAGIAGSKIYFAKGREYHVTRYAKNQLGKVFWYAGGSIDWKNMYAGHRGVDEVDHGQYDTIEQTPFVSGCSMMVARSVFEIIGLLDERFFLYLEDLDFCLRAKRAGYMPIYCPDSVVWHVNAGSSGGPGNPLHTYYMTRNRLIVGMRFASVRTKLALIKESLRFVFGADPLRRKAVVDAALGRLGKQYDPKKQH